MSASNLTEKDTGFFILLPPGSGVSDEQLQSLAAVKQDQSIHMFISDWLVYEVEGEEDSFCFQIPGIKLYFKNETDLDKSKGIADQILAELNDKTRLDLQLVIIDKARLINSQ